VPIVLCPLASNIPITSQESLLLVVPLLLVALLLSLLELLLGLPVLAVVELLLPFNRIFSPIAS
jgi:hypothetical protein